jgi:hypothetical protein
MIRSTLVVLLLAGSGMADDLKSGPQPGQRTGAFFPLFINGPLAGQQNCPVWVRSYSLTSVIFAREVSGPLTSLVKMIDKQLDEASVRHPSPTIRGVFVIFCTDDAGMNQRLKDLAAKEGLKHVVLCTTNAAGPPQYKVASEADLTVLTYKPVRTVVANIPLRKGELNEERTKMILKELSQSLPK